MSTSARNFVSSALTVAALSLALHAQAPAFEVASIKRNVSGDPRSGSQNLPGGRVAINNQRLRQVIRSAYGANDLEVVGGPDWIDNDRWDIVATAGGGNPDAPWREMLKSLLIDRFKLRAHVEMRERPIYALVFARTDKRLGPSIHPTACEKLAECSTTNANTSGIIAGTITGVARTLPEIGRSLSGYAERRVFDRTGLEGRYDFELKWSEEISIFTALPDQLGLKLESQRTPLDVVVIDSAERPTED